MAVRIGILISIRGTRDMIRPQRVREWQRQKAELIVSSFEVHLRYDTWGGFHYFRNVSKVHMVGTWDLDRDCAVTKDVTLDLVSKQLTSIEENKAIWSLRFMKRYGNPTLLVLDPKQRMKILEDQAKPISQSEIESTTVFAVRKRLNVFEDGPRLLIIDIVKHCIVNELPPELGYDNEDEDIKEKQRKSNKKKEVAAKETSSVRKVLTFQSILAIVPHEERETFVTIRFKTRQRDYDFDFPRARDRKVFMAKMKQLLPAGCFSNAQATHQVNKKPNYSENKSAMRSNISSVQTTGTLPWTFDRFGNPTPKIEHNPLHGRNPHPDAELAPARAHAATCLIPPNAITPGLSNQQAAYLQSRPEVAQSFYGHSVYHSTRENDTLSISASRRSPVRSSRRAPSGTGHYLGDRFDRSSVRSGGKSSRSPRTRGSSRRLADDEASSLRSFSVGAAGTVRGERHGQVDQTGTFTSADHCIAFKLLHRISDSRQLTMLQVKEAVMGQYAELAVKKQMVKLIGQQQELQHKRRAVFNRKVYQGGEDGKGLIPSKDMLDEVTREMMGLEECKRFRVLLTAVADASVREQLGFPLAFAIPQRIKNEDEEGGEEEEEDEEEEDGSASNRSMMSRHSVRRGQLRHPILGELFLEARPAKGNLLDAKYAILSRDTKQPLLLVQRQEKGIVFLDQDLEIASFHVVTDNLWRCTMFGESEDFVVTDPKKENTGHSVYTLERANLPDLLVSWKPGRMHFKTHSLSLGDLQLDQSQGKWSFKLDQKDEYFPFFLLWGAGWAVEHANTWKPAVDLSQHLDFGILKFW